MTDAVLNGSSCSLTRIAGVHRLMKMPPAGDGGQEFGLGPKSSDQCGVQSRRLGVYSPVKSVPVVPTPVLLNLAEPFRKFSQQVDELLGDVSDGPLDLSLVLRVVRVREQRLHSVVLTPSLPRLLELDAVVRQDFLRLPR